MVSVNAVLDADVVHAVLDADVDYVSASASDVGPKSCAPVHLYLTPKPKIQLRERR